MHVAERIRSLTVSGISICLLAASLTAELSAEPVTLDTASITHVHFKRITPNTVRIRDGRICFLVDKSSSFLLYPFDSVSEVNAVSFDWRSEGVLRKRDAAHESSRDGDDARLRVGLIIEGEAALLPNPLAPKWAKQVQQTLRFPSDRMLYLIVDAKHAIGESWKSPYSDDVDMVAVNSTALQDGWMHSHHVLASTQKVVGLWLMADGDNTESVFRSQLRNLVIE